MVTTTVCQSLKKKMSDINKHDSLSSCFDKHFYQSEVYLTICEVNYTVGS